MNDVLLTSENYIRDFTNVSDNLAGKFLLSSIREAQEGPLRETLGDCIVDALKRMVGDGSINDPANVAYKALLDRIQPLLAYIALTNVVMKVSYKIDNFGLSRTTDENQTFASFDEVAKAQFFYQSKADVCTASVQRWLIENRAAFPELQDCDCRKLKANLVSAASCGIWLGGPRGKGPQRRGGRRR